MGNKTRHTANLVSDNNIFVDIASDRVGIGSTQPTAKLNIAGIVSATSFVGDGSGLTNLTGSYSNSDVDSHLNVSGASSGQILSWNGFDYAWVADQTGGGGGSYANSDVDAHLNVSGASSGQILSWNGSDYAWVADQTGGGGSGITTANINADTINSGTLNVTGVSTFTSTVEITPSSNVKGLVIDSTNAATENNAHITLRGNGPQSIDFRDSGSGNGNGLKLAYRTGPNQWKLEKSESSTYNFLVADRDDGRVELYYGGGKKLETTGIGVSIYNDLNVGTGVTIYGNAGIVSATKLYGDGSNLTGIGTVAISDNAPSSPNVGDLWWESDTASGFIYYNDGNSSQWVEFNPTGSAGPANATISDNAPNSPTHGDLWWESDTATGHIYYNDGNSAQWVQFNSGSSGSGSSSGIGTSRFSVSNTTGSIGAGTTADITITGAKAYSLFKIDTSHAAWVRLYTDTTSRTNDASRAYTTDPTPGSGVLAEVYTTTSGSNTFKMTPAVTGWNDDSTPSTNIYAKVTNNESSAQDITVTLTILRMED